MRKNNRHGVIGERRILGKMLKGREKDKATEEALSPK